MCQSSSDYRAVIKILKRSSVFIFTQSSRLLGTIWKLKYFLPQVQIIVITALRIASFNYPATLHPRTTHNVRSACMHVIQQLRGDAKHASVFYSRNYNNYDGNVVYTPRNICMFQCKYFSSLMHSIFVVTIMNKMYR